MSFKGGIFVYEYVGVQLLYCVARNMQLMGGRAILLQPVLFHQETKQGKSCFFSTIFSNYSQIIIDLTKFDKFPLFPFL